jgi:hypothetical protein
VNAPNGAPVVTTTYEGSLFGLNYRPCNKSFEQPCDYSVQVLAILEMLFNANKSAKDILYTPRVQIQ